MSLRNVATPLRIFRVAALVLALALVAAACGNGASEPPDAAAESPAQAPTGDAEATEEAPGELVQLDIAASLISAIPYMTALQVAVDKGWFEEEGLEVTVLDAGGGGDTTRVLTAGEVDLAIAGPEAIYLASLQPASNIQIIGGWFQINIVAWVGDEPDQSLEGVKLGVTGAGSTGELMAKAIQATEPDLGIEIVVVGGLGDNFTAMKAGEIDGAYTADPFKTNQVVTQDAHVLLEARDIIGDVPMNLVAANTNYAAEHPEALEAFWRVAARAFEYIRADTDAALADINEYIDIDPEILSESVKNTPRFDEAWTINVQCESFENLSNEFVLAGVIDEPIDWASVLDQQYLQEDARCDEF